MITIVLFRESGRATERVPLWHRGSTPMPWMRVGLVQGLGFKVLGFRV